MYFFGFNWLRFWQKLTPANPFYFLNKLCSGPKVTKKFTAVIYECSYQAKVLVPAKPFQPSLTFVGKERSLL